MPHPGGRQDNPRGFLRKLAEFIHPGLGSRSELFEALADAEDNQVIHPESRAMLEGVLRMADMTAGDVMVAAPRMDVLDIDADPDDILVNVIDTGHSRFPVFEGARENIVGILMAKDLLKRQTDPSLTLRALIRPALFVPESKALNDLLREFRGNRNHLAIVIDEFGRVAGLVTIEDVLEQIVGDIEDEFDESDSCGSVFAVADGTWRVSGDTSLERFNQWFDVQVPVDDFDTIGGLVVHNLGRVPRRGEHCDLDGLRLEALMTKGGVVRWFKVSRIEA